MKPVRPMIRVVIRAMRPKTKGTKPYLKPSSAMYMTVTSPRPVETIVATAMWVLRPRPATRKSEMPLMAPRANVPATMVPPT